MYHHPGLKTLNPYIFGLCPTTLFQNYTAPRGGSFIFSEKPSGEKKFPIIRPPIYSKSKTEPKIDFHPTSFY